jgi:hypothetical protein
MKIIERKSVTSAPKRRGLLRERLRKTLFECGPRPAISNELGTVFVMPNLIRPMINNSVWPMNGVAVLCGGASVVVRFGFSLRYTANAAGEAALRLPWVEPILIEIFSNLARSADRDVLLCRIVASM